MWTTKCLLSQIEQSKIFETTVWFLAFSKGEKTPQDFYMVHKQYF